MTYLLTMLPGWGLCATYEFSPLANITRDPLVFRPHVKVIL